VRQKGKFALAFLITSRYIIASNQGVFVMNKLIVRGSVVFAISTVLVSVFWWRTLLWTGQLDGVKPHFDGQCSVAAPIVGAEDLVIDRENRLVYISSDDRRNPKNPGSIWIMPVDAPEQATPMLLPNMNEALFAPHGLDLFIGADGKRYLFVIDHGVSPKEVVRKFLISGDQLLLQDSFESPLFYSPNDIAAAGENQFYLTNDKQEKTGSLSELLGVLFKKKSGNVVWSNGRDSKIVADGFSYANGIAVSKDKKQLYVSATIDQDLRIFDRDQSTGDLTLVDSVFLGSGLDNIDVAEDGSLWIGSHPRLLDFSAHAKNKNNRSPSQVFRVDITKKTITEIYASKGDPLSASSVAATIDQTLFIGGVFDEAVLVCQQEQETK